MIRIKDLDSNEFWNLCSKLELKRTTMNTGKFLDLETGLRITDQIKDLDCNKF